MQAAGGRASSWSALLRARPPGRHATTPRHLGYVPQLDGLRALAVGMVMLFHLEPGRAKGGWIGVDVFFVLSGFLITSLLAEELARTGSIHYGRFLLRRLFRLYPGLVALLVGATVWAELVGVPHWGTIASWTLEVRRNIVDTGINQNAIHTNVLGPTWSLAMEDQFYLVWPVVLIAASRYLSRRGVAAVAGLGAVGSMVANIVLVAQGAPIQRIIFGPDCTAGYLLVGCVAGMLFVNGDLDRFRGGRLARLVPPGMTAVLLVAFLTVNETVPKLHAGPTTLLATGCAGLVVGVVLAPDAWFARWLSRRPLVLVGQWSYSLYLWHVLGYYIVTRSLDPGGQGAASLAAQLAVAVALGITSYYLVERPVRNWGRTLLQQLSERGRATREPATESA